MKKNPKILLVTHDSNYSDEFDTYGIALYPEQTWNDHMNEVKKLFKATNKEREVYFGTNETMIYETFATYKDSFKVKVVSKAEIATLKKTLGLKIGKSINSDYDLAKGLFPTIDVELCKEDDDYEKAESERIAKLTCADIFRMDAGEASRILSNYKDEKFFEEYSKYCSAQHAKKKGKK